MTDVGPRENPIFAADTSESRNDLDVQLRSSHYFFAAVNSYGSGIQGDSVASREYRINRG